MPENEYLLQLLPVPAEEIDRLGHVIEEQDALGRDDALVDVIGVESDLLGRRPAQSLV